MLLVIRTLDAFQGFPPEQKQAGLPGSSCLFRETPELVHAVATALRVTLQLKVLKIVSIGETRKETFEVVSWCS